MIERGNGEDAEAALRTERLQNKVMAAAADCIGKRCSDDRDKGLYHVGSMEFALCATVRGVHG